MVSAERDALPSSPASAPADALSSDDPATEIPLTGGRITLGVVRVGNTVRRAAQRSSPFVQQLLELLAERAFAGAPRHLGTDGQGRDTLRFIEGHVPPRFRRFERAQVHAAGALLRAFHDATRGSTLAGKHPVVCHHDPGPNNCVFQNDVPTAWIDFDLAAPGNPLEDVAAAAWMWCLSSRPDRELIDEQAAHVRALVDGYGLGTDDRMRLVDGIPARLTANETFWLAYEAGPGQASVPRERIDEIVAWTRRERAFTRRHRDVLQRALS